MDSIDTKENATPVRVFGQDSTNAETNPVNATTTGGLHTNLRDSAGNELSSGTSTADGILTSLVTLFTKTKNYVFNGTTWDRMRSATIGNNVASTGLPTQVTYGQYNSAPPNISSGNYTALQTTKKGSLLNTLYDTEINSQNVIDFLGSLKVSELTKLVGGYYVGSSLNSNVWTSTVSAGGTNTVGSQLLRLRTNTTANGSAAVQSIDVAGMVPGTVNSCLLDVRLEQINITNNEKRWGAWTTTNGLYFKYAGSTFSVCRLQNGVETSVNSGSFSYEQPVIDTNFHKYEILYTSGSAYFFQDRRLLHVLTTTTTALVDNPHFPIRYANTNISSSTTDTSMYIREASIHRFGRPRSRTRTFFTSDAGATVLKTEPGTVHRIIVARTGGLGTFNATLYDNTSASGRIITRVSLGSNTVLPLELDVDFNIGLTISNSNANLEVTVVWE